LVVILAPEGHLVGVDETSEDHSYAAGCGTVDLFASGCLS
jgi:hypothetical protein